jgi:hypothetical protein
MTKTSYARIAEHCLNKYWNSKATDFHGGGWDIGSPAHLHAKRWAKKNLSSLKRMSWPQIFQAYKRTLVQE